MNREPKNPNHTGFIRTVLVAAAIVGFATAARAANYVGPYSNDPANPTSLDFSVGDNVVTGATGGFVSNYFSFVISPGEDFTNLYVEAASKATDLTFIGIEAGPAITAGTTPPDFSSAGLAGYTLYDSDDLYTDILPAIGKANPPGFPNAMFGGATTFKPPLPAGTYSVWVVDGDNAPGSVPFSLDFVVSSVPEPSTWALMIAGLGGIGLMLRRAKRAGSVSLKNSFLV